MDTYQSEPKKDDESELRLKNKIGLSLVLDLMKVSKDCAAEHAAVGLRELLASWTFFYFNGKNPKKSGLSL